MLFGNGGKPLRPQRTFEEQQECRKICFKCQTFRDGSVEEEPRGCGYDSSCCGDRTQKWERGLLEGGCLVKKW